MTTMVAYKMSIFSGKDVADNRCIIKRDIKIEHCSEKMTENVIVLVIKSAFSCSWRIG